MKYFDDTEPLNWTDQIELMAIIFARVLNTEPSALGYRRRLNSTARRRRYRGTGDP